MIFSGDGICARISIGRLVLLVSYLGMGTAPFLIMWMRTGPFVCYVNVNCCYFIYYVNATVIQSWWPLQVNVNSYWICRWVPLSSRVGVGFCPLDICTVDFFCATWHSVVLLNIQCAVLKRVLSVIHVLLCSFYTAWSKLCSVVLLCSENSIQCGPCAVLKRVLNPVFVPYIFLFN